MKVGKNRDFSSMILLLIIFLFTTFLNIDPSESRTYTRQQECVSIESFYKQGNMEGPACNVMLELVFLRLSQYRESDIMMHNNENFTYSRDFLLKKSKSFSEFYVIIDDILYNFAHGNYFDVMRGLEIVLPRFEKDLSFHDPYERMGLYYALLSKIYRAAFSKIGVTNSTSSIVKKLFSARIGSNLSRKTGTKISWSNHSINKIICIVNIDVLVVDFEIVRNSKMFSDCIGEGK